MYISIWILGHIAHPYRQRYVVSPSDKCTHCKSLWKKASAKCLKCKIQQRKSANQVIKRKHGRVVYFYFSSHIFGRLYVKFGLAGFLSRPTLSFPAALFILSKPRWDMKMGRASWAFLRTSPLRSSRQAYRGARHSRRSEGPPRSVARRSVSHPSSWWDENRGDIEEMCD